MTAENLAVRSDWPALVRSWSHTPANVPRARHELRRHLAQLGLSALADIAEIVVPYVEIQIVGDVWFTSLDPDDVATVAAALRAQADRLDHDVRPRLIAYRDDWTAQRAT